MADKSKIEWTDATWNPIRGCSRVSEGCRNCYAETFAARFTKPGQPFEGLAYRNKSGAHWTGAVKIFPKHLEDPLHWKEPRRVFVNSMADLFHELIPLDWIDRIFSRMGACDDAELGHIFQILTKRQQRMMDYMQTRARKAWNGPRMNRSVFPPRNVWLGVSIEDQKTVDERIPLLLQTPAAVRWVSAEPLLGPTDITEYLGWNKALKNKLDWVVVGGESGHGARPCAIEWIESIVEQCKAANVPVFVKQLGAFVVSEQRTAPAAFMKSAGYRGARQKAPNGEVWAWRAGLQDRKGGNIAEFPDNLQVREFPSVEASA